MGETKSPSVAHVGCYISSLSRVEKYRNPRATEGESIYNTRMLLVNVHIDKCQLCCLSGNAACPSL